MRWISELKKCITLSSLLFSIKWMARWKPSGELAFESDTTADPCINTRCFSSVCACRLSDLTNLPFPAHFCLLVLQLRERERERESMLPFRKFIKRLNNFLLHHLYVCVCVYGERERGRDSTISIKYLVLLPRIFGQLLASTS